jgi:hypothetical protein
VLPELHTCHRACELIDPVLEPSEWQTGELFELRRLDSIGRETGIVTKGNTGVEDVPAVRDQRPDLSRRE